MPIKGRPYGCRYVNVRLPGYYDCYYSEVADE